ncbi:hypothetical protein Tco_0132266 [Tanacetum coccineum]
MDSIAQCMVERASHEQELKMTLKRLIESKVQIQECTVQKVQSSVTSSGDETSSGIVSDEEIDKQELEAHFGFMAKIQEVSPDESSSTDTPLEQVTVGRSTQRENYRSTFANPKYLKIAQSEKPRLYEIPYDTSDPANRFCPNGRDSDLERRVDLKLDKTTVKPYDLHISKQAL